MPLDATASFVNGAWFDRDGLPVAKPGALRASVTLAANGAAVAAVAGKKIRVLGFLLSALLATNIKFQTSTGSVDISSTLCLAATGGFSVPECQTGWWETGVGDALNINMSVNTTVGVTVLYVLV